MTQDALPAGCRESGVHPTAVIDAGAVLAPDVSVAAYAVIGAGVEIGGGTVVGPHVVLEGPCRIGPDNTIGAHAVIGALPQLRSIATAGTLEIGRGNCIRELVTVHRGSAGAITRIGDGNLLMAYAHVGHDAVLGDGNELANGVQIAGHVTVGDGATIGGLAAVHQYARIGSYSMIAAGSMVSQDVLPYSLVGGDRARVYGINAVGLRRCGVSAATRRSLATALRLLLDAPTLDEGLSIVRSRFADLFEVQLLCSFAAASRRGLCRSVCLSNRSAAGGNGDG